MRLGSVSEKRFENGCWTVTIVLVEGLPAAMSSTGEIATAAGRRLDLARSLRHPGDSVLLGTRLSSHGDQLEELELSQNDLGDAGASTQCSKFSCDLGR